MKNYYLYILFLLAISFNTSLFAQDSEEDAVEYYLNCSNNFVY